MKMRNMNSLLYSWVKALPGALLMAVTSLSLLSSCDDFLSIEPQNEIVLENYWTEEKDVNSVLNSC